MNVLLLSRYGDLGASSRYRFYQYLPYLQSKGINITVAPFFDNNYLKNFYAGRGRSAPSILRAYGERISRLIRAKEYSLIWVEKEVLPWLPAWVEQRLALARLPYVLDYDDAIFHSYDLHRYKLVRILLGRKIQRLMQNAAFIMAGNDYLANFAKNAGAKRVEVLPTVIDLKRYPSVPPVKNNVFTIGWIGTPATSRYLRIIKPALQEFCSSEDAQVVLIGAEKMDLPGVPVQYVSWAEATEVEEIQRFDVGIMPLPDEPFEWGKCGFKLIQYMACCRPVIGSPVGVNRKIIKPGLNGYQAGGNDEWVRALRILIKDKKICRHMGEAGRKLVEKDYCLQATAAKLMKLLSSVSNR